MQNIIMATRKKILSDRQRRRLRANVAKQMVEHDVQVFRKRSSHCTAPLSECVDESHGQADDTPANVIDHGDVEEALCDIDVEPSGSGNSVPPQSSESSDIDNGDDEEVLYDIDDEQPRSGNSVSQSSDSSEYMSSASGGDDTLSSSSLEDYTSENSDDFSDFEGYSSANSECEETKGVRRLLYPGAQLSSHEFSVALMSVYQKHNLTYSAIEDILKLFQCVLSSPNAVPTSQHTLLREFVTYNTETILHRCCGTCCQLLPDGSCTRRECRASGAREATFVEVAIDAQIKERFMGKLILTVIF